MEWGQNDCLVQNNLLLPIGVESFLESELENHNHVRSHKKEIQKRESLTLYLENVSIHR